MNHGEQHDHIETAAGAIEEAFALLVSPSGGGSGSRQVDHQGQDVKTFGVGFSPYGANHGRIGIDGDYACAGFRGKKTEMAFIRPDIEHLTRPRERQRASR